MRFLLIPLDHARPHAEAFLNSLGDKPLTPSEIQATAETLERCVRTGKLLVGFALLVAGRPSMQ